ncbi:MAG: hypothetical protein JSS09_02810 [Verrucomicrobia bacterium]|nr:hypothetical protein [Verrucomicrobiota bacterium]
MSAFLKRDDLEEGESDLTGDSGVLALKMLSEKVATFNGYVVDIGGQDQSFVRQFSSATKRVVMDINALAWALDKTPGVVYALGSADVVLEKSRFLSEEQRPETIFTMSNFFNVLSPEFSWRMLDSTIAQMKPGDRLVITNLYRDNFFEEKKVGASENDSKQVKSNYREGRSHLGIYEFNKAKTGEHYKSTIGDDFVSHVKHVHSDIELLQQKRSTRNCKVKTGRTAPVKFITLEFIKTEPITPENR